MGKIETGADRLMDLISKEKRVSIDDAAKKLGISKIVIQEWADFLEEEKIISIEYKFSKTFLVERKLSNVEIKEKEKEYSSEKDAFVRKVENSLRNLEKDTLGFENIKQEFDGIKKDIGGELEKVRNEVKELEKYEYLKKNLDKDVEKQISEFHDIIDKAHQDVGEEQKKYQGLLEELEVEKREFQVKEHRLLTLEEKEKELMQRLQEIYSLSKEIESRVNSEKLAISASEKKILEMGKAVKNIENSVVKKKLEIQPLVDRAKQHEDQIMKLQDEILQKAREKTEAIRSKVEEGSKVLGNFQRFFDKKDEVEELIQKTDGEKKELEDAFLSLQKKALVFDLASKSSTVNAHVKELEKSLEEVNTKKEKFKENLEKLIKLVKG